MSGKEIEKRTEPLVPAWITSRSVALSYTRQVAKRTGYGSARLLKKSPGWIVRNVGTFLKGITIICGHWWNWVTAASIRTAIQSSAATTGVIDYRAEEKRQDRVSKRWKVSLVTVALLTISLLVLFYFYSWTPLILALLAVVTTAELVGYRYSNTDPEIVSSLPDSPLSMGIPLRQLGESIVEALTDMKIPRVAIHKLFVAKDGNGWVGVVFSPSKPLTDDVARALEPQLMAPTNSISFAQDPNNAASYNMQIDLDDPLAGVPEAPETDMGSLSVTQPLLCGIGRSGRQLFINFLRAHVAMVGRTRSGKSSALWRVIEQLSACFDVALVSVDLTNGPAFPSWRGVIQRKATTPEETEQLLLDLLAESQRRTDILAERAASDDDDIEETWRPTREDPQITCLIDEYSILAENAKLLNLVKVLSRTSAKAAITLVLATQEATKDAFGSTAIRGSMLVKILFGCSADDVTTLLGRGALAQGWRADRLRSAAGSDPGDAGKCVISSADHNTPDLWRWFRYELATVRRIAKRRENDVPVIALAQNAIVVPPVIAMLAGAFGHYDEDGLPSEEIVKFAKEYDPQEFGKLTMNGLADALKNHQLRPTQLGQTRYGSNRRGYKRSDVARVLEQY